MDTSKGHFGYIVVTLIPTLIPSGECESWFCGQITGVFVPLSHMWDMWC